MLGRSGQLAQKCSTETAHKARGQLTAWPGIFREVVHLARVAREKAMKMLCGAGGAAYPEFSAGEPGYARF